MKIKLISLLALLGMLIFVGCDSRSNDTPVGAGPKTTLGKSMEIAHGASNTSDLRNDEMKKQADALKDE